jgi:hypothetical protein
VSDNPYASLLQRALDGVSAALDFAESRPRAWLVAAAGVVITVGCWWIVLTSPAELFRQPNKFLTAVLMAAVLAGPFLMVAALAQAVRRDGAEDTWSDSGLLFNEGGRIGADRRRRAILSAALLSVLNAFILFLARIN